MVSEKIFRTMTAPIPPWLCGAWVRRAIRRFDPATGAPVNRAADAAVEVRYVQTPGGHFVDVAYFYEIVFLGVPDGR